MVQMNTLDNLSAFQNAIDGWTWRALYVSIYDDIGMADHMWNKFHGYNHQILLSWSNADNNNRKILLAMINKWVDMKKKNVNMWNFVKEMNIRQPGVIGRG